MFFSRKVPFAGILSACIACAGCFSIDVGRLESTGEENLTVSNYGWYLFNCIPLASGNANSERLAPWVLFRNDVTMDKVQQRFFAYARENGMNVSELSYHNYESILFEIPGTNFKIPVPYLLTFREIQLSGVLK